jgi:hypothetical protein
VLNPDPEILLNPLVDPDCTGTKKFSLVKKEEFRVLKSSLEGWRLLLELGRHF